MNDTLVLAYHAVSRHWPDSLAVAPEHFEAHMRMLVRRGYRGATVHDAVHDRSTGRTVAVTFDDAYRSVLDLAFPILESVGFPGTVFVPTDYPDHDQPMAWPKIDRWLGGPYESELRCLSWSNLRTLADAGWEIGAHTRSHPNLTQASDDELEHELRGSRERCEQELRRPCLSLAYPYGLWDARVVAAVRAAGFMTACTVPDRLSTEDPLRWPRVGIWREDGPVAVRLKVSPLARRARATPVADAILPLLRRVLLYRPSRRRSSRPEPRPGPAGAEGESYAQMAPRSEHPRSS